MLKYFGIVCGVCCICTVYGKNDTSKVRHEEVSISKMSTGSGTIVRPNADIVSDACEAYAKQFVWDKLHKASLNESDLKLLGKKANKSPEELFVTLRAPSIESLLWLEHMCKTTWRNQKALVMAIATVFELQALEYAYSLQETVVSSIGQLKDNTSLKARMWVITVPIKALVSMIRGMAKDLLNIAVDGKDMKKSAIFAHSKLSDEEYIANSMKRINNYVTAYNGKIEAGLNKDQAHKEACAECLYTDVGLVSIPKNSVIPDLVPSLNSLIPSITTIQQMIMFPRELLSNVVINTGIKSVGGLLEVGTNETFNNELEKAYEAMSKIIFSKDQPQTEFKKRKSIIGRILPFKEKKKA